MKTFNLTQRIKRPRMYKTPWWPSKKCSWRPSCFQNEAKNIPRQTFVMMNISCKFENSADNTVCSRGCNGKNFYTLLLHDWQRNALGSHLLQNKAKNIYRQDFVMMNTSWEFKISTYSAFCCRGVKKSLLKDEKCPWQPSCFSKWGQKYSQARFCNDESILQIWKV